MEVINNKDEAVERGSFSTPVFGIRNAQDADPLFQSLVKSAKKQLNVPGALYIAAITIPLGKPNARFIAVESESVTKQFLKSFIEPYPIPILYNHADSAGGMFEEPPSNPPRIYGRVLSVSTGTIKHSGKTMEVLATGQIITDEEAKCRIESMTDFSQSISWLAESKKCSICSEPPGYCDHRPGRVEEILNDKGEVKGEKLALELHVPKRAIENSFVLIPAYEDAMLKAIERNSLVNQPSPYALLDFTVKNSVQGVELPKTTPSPESGEEGQVSPTGETNGTMITDETTIEGSEMDIKEILEKLTGIQNSVEAMGKEIDELKKASNSTPPAEPASGEPAKTENQGQQPGTQAQPTAGATVQPGASSEEGTPATQAGTTPDIKTLHELVTKMGLMLVKREEAFEKSFNTLTDRVKTLEDKVTASVKPEVPKAEGENSQNNSAGGASDGNPPAAEPKPNGEGEQQTGSSAATDPPAQNAGGNAANPESKTLEPGALTNQSIEALLGS